MIFRSQYFSWLGFSWFFVCLCFFLDRIIKFLIVSTPDQASFLLFRRYGGGVGFFPIYNKGIAFGLSLPSLVLYGLLSGIFCFLFFLCIRAIRFHEYISLFGLSMVLLGGLGNLYDRFAYGAVVDYIKIFIWPIFNIADLLILVGLFVWFLSERKISKGGVW